ncbi:MAG: DNA gyrase subunit A [candidate division Zixibacteria bacterium]|nr:DNA gyrase subunit A [candidate division Zixibacteria bacterium]
MAIEQRENIIDVFIEDEMKSSYIDYSMSVITSRALPDIRDGLKPSNRRILVAMNDLNLSPGRAHRKCAKICGDTSGNYHPHGEQVIYPTLVRMAQHFNMRYPLVDGQGNFGSIDGDAAAAMRYTEARLTPLAMEMLADIDKATVDYMPNYDETIEEPIVLPSKFPNLLCNGVSGIAVGMATNIPPHNLGEVADALTAIIDDKEVTDADLLKHISGPDFPTGGIIVGRSGIQQAYMSGRGRITLRAKANIETAKSGKENIIITEIPFQVNKANLLSKIADLVRDKHIEGIADLRDESDRDGMRIVVDMKRDANADVVLNLLFKMTQMQITYGIIMLALVNGIPKVVTLREMLEYFIDHRHEIIVRRTKFELDKAEKRAHILEGYKIALDNIDAVVELIKKSKDVPTARQGLIDRFGLTQIQAQAILDMRLQRLTGLEREKIEAEYKDLIKQIANLKDILDSQPRRMQIIKNEIQELRNKYADSRLTMIIDDEESDFTIEDLIAEEDMVITITHSGYIKRLSTSSYRKQRRGGRGVIGMETKTEDFIEHMFIASTHNYILFFSNRGKCYWLKVHEIPQGGRLARGKSMANLLQMEKEEYIAAFVPVRSFNDGKYIVMATEHGIVKKTELTAFSNPRKVGIIAINVPKEDRLIEVGLTDGTCDIILATRNGQAIRFHEQVIRAMGRTAYGVKGISLSKDDICIGMVVIRREATLLTVCEHGYGKRSPISAYRITNRGGKGIINIKTSERNGKVITIKEVVDEDELMLISYKGIIVRIAISTIKPIGRNTQGVKLMNLGKGDKIVDVARIAEENGQEE